MSAWCRKSEKLESYFCKPDPKNVCVCSNFLPIVSSNICAIPHWFLSPLLPYVWTFRTSISLAAAAAAFYSADQIKLSCLYWWCWKCSGKCHHNVNIVCHTRKTITYRVKLHLTEAEWCFRDFPLDQAVNVFRKPYIWKNFTSKRFEICWLTSNHGGMFVL